MFKRQTDSARIDEAVSKSVNFELTIAEMAKRSERRAWWVAVSAIVLALILAGGCFYLFPLKEKVPYLVMADAYSGTATVARLVENMADQRITSSEAINRSNVAHFVIAREAYDLAMLNLRDWTTVQTMSAPGVAAVYTNLYSSANPENPYKIYGKDRAIRIRILSITLLGDGAGVPPKGATVRFQRSLYDKLSGATRPMDSKIATLEFTYKANLKMDEQYRLENPLGFQVTSYRVDSDFSSSAPQEIPMEPLQASAYTAPAAANPAQQAADALSPQPDLTIPPPPISEHGAVQVPPAATSAAPAATAPAIAPTSNTTQRVRRP